MCFYAPKFTLCMESRPLAQPLAHISILVCRARSSHGFRKAQGCQPFFLSSAFQVVARGSIIFLDMTSMMSARREAQRFRYIPSSRSGFIELNTYIFSPADLRTCLLEVPGVLQVVGHRLSKTEQNNFSLGHCQQRNWKVRTAALVRAGVNDMEFELTTTSNLSDTFLEQNGIIPSVTAMFKDAPSGMLMEAWRVLRLAVGHLARFPLEVAAWEADLTWEELPTQKTGVFSKFMDENNRIWFSNDADPSMIFFEDEAASKGWTKYYDRVPGMRYLERHWWHNAQLHIYFFEI